MVKRLSRSMQFSVESSRVESGRVSCLELEELTRQPSIFIPKISSVVIEINSISVNIAKETTRQSTIRISIAVERRVKPILYPFKDHAAAYRS